MQNNELMIRQENMLIPNEAEWEVMKETAAMIVRGGLIPNTVNTPEKAITIMLKGRELNLPPMISFSHINIIQGRPSISAELMLALVYKNLPGVSIQFKQLDNEACVIHAKRPDSKEYTVFSFTIEDAKKAQLIKSNSGWDKYPRAMLRSRAVSEMCRSIFPDVIMGCSYTPEELGAEVDEQGELVSTNNIDTKYNDEKLDYIKQLVKELNKNGITKTVIKNKLITINQKYLTLKDYKELDKSDYDSIINIFELWIEQLKTEKAEAVNEDFSLNQGEDNE